MAFSNEIGNTLQRLRERESQEALLPLGTTPECVPCACGNEQPFIQLSRSGWLAAKCQETDRFKNEEEEQDEDRASTRKPKARAKY